MSASAPVSAPRILLWVPIIGAALLSLVAPLLLGRILGTSDTRLHTLWTGDFAQALTEGYWMPRWVPSTYEGFGDPGFVFLHPAFYYLASLGKILGLETRYAILGVVALTNVLLGYSTWRFFQPRMPVRLALAAALLMQLSPALLALALLYSAFPWYSATFAFAATMFASARLAESPSAARVWPVALGVCVTTLFHVLSGLMLLACAAGAIVFMSLRQWRGAGRARVIYWGLGAALGLGLAAFYLFPALGLRSEISTAQWFIPGVIDWHDSFLFPVVTAKVFGVNWKLFQYYLPALALLLIGASLWMRWRLALPSDGAAMFFGLFALCGLLLGSELAYPLWKYSGTLQTVQRGYRFLEPVTLGAIGLFVVTCRDWYERRPRTAQLAVTAALGLFVLVSAALSAKVVLIDGSSTARAFSLGNNSRGAREYATRLRGPEWEAYAKQGGLAGYCERHALGCEVVARDTHSLSVVVDAKGPTELVLPHFAFAGWQVNVDGGPDAAGFDAATGLISTRLTAGRHRVQLAYARTRIEWLGIAASGLSLLGFGLVAWRASRDRR